MFAAGQAQLQRPFGILLVDAHPRTRYKRRKGNVVFLGHGMIGGDKPFAVRFFGVQPFSRRRFTIFSAFRRRPQQIIVMLPVLSEMPPHTGHTKKRVLCILPLSGAFVGSSPRRSSVVLTSSACESLSSTPTSGQPSPRSLS